MKKLVLIGMLLVPCTANADKCQLVEYPDHYEVECEGNTKPVIMPAAAVQPQNTVQSQAPETVTDTAQEEKTTPSKTTAPEAVKKAVPTVIAPVTRRQGRPPTADRDAAAEARRSLILEQRPKEPTIPDTIK